MWQDCNRAAVNISRTRRTLSIQRISFMYFGCTELGLALAWMTYPCRGRRDMKLTGRLDA